jgi:hypothetical protein
MENTSELQVAVADLGLQLHAGDSHVPFNTRNF